MNSKVFIFKHWFSFSILLLLLFANAVSAQEIKTETERINSTTERTYRYITDDRGRFDTLHGTQTSKEVIPAEKTTIIFDVECEYGKPVSFSYSAINSPYGALIGLRNVKCDLFSRGLYDQDGICTLSSYYYVPKDDRWPETERAVSAYRLGTKVCFMSEYIMGPSDKIYQYGWIDENNQCIISEGHINNLEFYSDGEYSLWNIILYNNYLLLFPDKDTMTEFSEKIIKYDAAVRVKDIGYQIIPLSKEQVFEGLQAPTFPRLNTYSGFTSCKKYDRFPDKYFFVPIWGGSRKGFGNELLYSGLNIRGRARTGVVANELHYSGLNISVFQFIKKAYIIKKDSLAYYTQLQDYSATYFRNLILESSKAAEDMAFDLNYVHNVLDSEEEANKKDRFLYSAAEFEKQYASAIYEMELEKRREAARQEQLQKQVLDAIYAKDVDTYNRLYKEPNSLDESKILKEAMMGAIEARAFDVFDFWLGKVDDARDTTILKQAIITCIEDNNAHAASNYVIMLADLSSSPKTLFTEEWDCYYKAYQSGDKSRMVALRDIVLYFEGITFMKKGNYNNAIDYLKGSKYADYKDRIKECKKAKKKK